MKAYIKKKKNIKFGNAEIQKQKFHRHKRSISIKNIDINKILVPLLVNRDLNISLASKMIKKLGIYVYFSKK